MVKLLYPQSTFLCTLNNQMNNLPKIEIHNHLSLNIYNIMGIECNIKRTIAVLCQVSNVKIKLGYMNKF